MTATTCKVMKRITKYLFSCMFAAAGIVPVNAQNAADLWISMPADMTPYLTLNQKKEMIECYNMGVDSRVDNKLSGKTTVDTLVADYGRFILSSAYSVEIIRLPYIDNDTILCKIDTYNAPAKKSRISFYDLHWQELPAGDKFPSMELAGFISRPDTMNVTEYEELCSLLSPEMISYNYDVNSHTLNINVSTPLLTSEEKQKINAILFKRVLIWRDRRFN